MFIKNFLCLLALAAFASAAVPSYIQTCNRRDPNVDKCILNSVTALTEKLRNGMPELEIPPVEPLKLDKITFADMPNFKSSAINIKVYGLSNFDLKYLHLDFEKQQIDIDVTFKETRIDGEYNVNAKILVPVEGTGPLHLTSRNVNAKAKMNFKQIERGGKKYLFFTGMTLRLDIKDYDTEYDTDSIDSTPLREAINQALGSNHKEIIDATRPTLEKAISALCLEISNKISKHFTFDELFPDAN